MSLRLYDAHNHLQDERLSSELESIMAALEREHITKMVVNGSCEQDWPAVLALAQKSERVIPSFPTAILICVNGHLRWPLETSTAIGNPTS